jgi:(R)-2-hydroxyacyl-CoA dehydratese activating ATPase
MLTLGLDIGSLNVKAVCLVDQNIAGTGIVLVGDDVENSARLAINSAMKNDDTNLTSVPILATGAGVKSVSFVQQQKSLTTCLARGVHHLSPAARMAIDMGAESTTVIKISEKGKVMDWVNHDKCASGTGLFLQQMAKLMGNSFAEMSQLSHEAKSRAEISNTCAVFAESEVISHVHRVPPTPKEDIVAGINFSVVCRILALCKRIGITRDVAVTGGVALNEGLVTILEQELSYKVLRLPSPQTIAALGAAIIARENLEKGFN